MQDAVVIGAGPNGLVAAATLARHGWSVLVLESRERPGGAVWSEALTRPGFVHDVGAAFFGFSEHGPAFRDLDLTGAGLEWRNADYESSHPAPDGTCASIARDRDRTGRSFGPDGPAWARLADWANQMGGRLIPALLAPVLEFGPKWRLGPTHLCRLGLAGLQSSAGYSLRHFQTEAARRVLPGLALHVDLGPDDLAGNGLGLTLALSALTTGFRVPVGGAKAVTGALVRRLEEAGGTLRYETTVERVVTRRGRAVAIRTTRGDEIPFRRACLADVGAPALYLKMLDARDVPGWVRRSLRRFRYGWGTFKVDWALSGPVPWLADEARAAAVVHAGDSLEDLRRFTREVRAGRLPSNPYLVIGQQSLVDPTRAPDGCHTLWAYSHAPAEVPDGWGQHRAAFADRVERRIGALAPGFRQRILGRAAHAPPDLERMDANLVGGDLGGGSARIGQQLVFRPVFPYFRYRTPVRGLYLCSASAHPGAGAHGACGYNAAHQALRE